MAADDDLPNEPDTIKSAFSCCKSKKCAVAVCVNCGGIFHKSCIQRSKNIIQISETIIKCCESNLIPDLEKQRNLEVVQTGEDVTLEKLKVENLMLKKLLDESEIKFKLLENNNKLLEENKKLLEEKIEIMKKETEGTEKKVNKNVPQKNINKNSYSSVATVNKQQEKNVDIQNTVNIVKTSGKATQQDINLNELEITQRNKMMEIINLTNDNKVNDFREVSYHRKKRNAPKQYGENENKEFAIGRKVWLYLYRIKRHITEDKIKQFITNQQKFKDADIVRELPTRENQNKCFMFGINWELKDDIYEPSTWPNSMAYKRFDFSKYYTYENKSRANF